MGTSYDFVTDIIRSAMRRGYICFVLMMGPVAIFALILWLHGLDDSQDARLWVVSQLKRVCGPADGEACIRNKLDWMPSNLMRLSIRQLREENEAQGYSGVIKEGTPVAIARHQTLWPNSRNLEKNLYHLVMKSDNPDLLLDYLKKYPNSDYKISVLGRLAVLTGDFNHWREFIVAKPDGQMLLDLLPSLAAAKAAKSEKIRLMGLLWLNAPEKEKDSIKTKILVHVMKIIDDDLNTIPGILLNQCFGNSKLKNSQYSQNLVLSKEGFLELGWQMLYFQHGDNQKSEYTIEGQMMLNMQSGVLEFEKESYKVPGELHCPDRIKVTLSD